MPALELEGSRFRNSTNLFLILNGTTSYCRFCPPSESNRKRRPSERIKRVRIIVENGQNLISSRTVFLSNAKIQPFWKMEIVDDCGQFQNSDHGEYGSCA